MDPDWVIDEQDKLRPSIDGSHSRRGRFERVPDIRIVRPINTPAASTGCSLMASRGTVLSIAVGPGLLRALKCENTMPRQKSTCTLSHTEFVTVKSFCTKLDLEMRNNQTR